MPQKSSPLFSFTWEGKAVGKNGKFLGRSSKVLSPKYRAFVADIADTCWANTPARDYGRAVRLEITISSSLRDAHNIEEPLFDGIEASGVIANDSQIKSHSLTALPHKRGAPDRIEVKAFNWEMEYTGPPPTTGHTW